MKVSTDVNVRIADFKMSLLVSFEFR